MTFESALPLRSRIGYPASLLDSTLLDRKIAFESHVAGESMPVISITRLRVRSMFYLPAFAFRTFQIARQAKRADGNLAVRLLRDRHWAFWTATAWSSEAAMRVFMMARPHGPTMRRLLHWCDEASLVHWTQSEADVPNWPEAHRRLLEQGRPSKVLHPTDAHTRHRLPEPEATITRELRMR